jgi:hypothetical protein
MLTRLLVMFSQPYAKINGPNIAYCGLRREHPGVDKSDRGCDGGATALWLVGSFGLRNSAVVQCIDRV